MVKSLRYLKIISRVICERGIWGAPCVFLSTPPPPPLPSSIPLSAPSWKLLPLNKVLFVSGRSTRTGAGVSASFLPLPLESSPDSIFPRAVSSAISGPESMSSIVRDTVDSLPQLGPRPRPSEPCSHKCPLLFRPPPAAPALGPWPAYRGMYVQCILYMYNTCRVGNRTSDAHYNRTPLLGICVRHLSDNATGLKDRYHSR